MAEREVTLVPPSTKAETDSCVTCGSIDNLKQCAKCLSVAYCCKEHQIQDWKKHKKNCKKIIQNGEQNSETKSQMNSTPVTETDRPDSNSDQSATINLSFEFDKRPYKPRTYLQPAGRDPVSLAQHVTSQLKSNNFCVVDSIFNPTLANAVLKEVIKLHSSGIFMDGQLSGGRRNSDTIVTKKTIRGDEITWLEGNEKEFPYICMLVKTLDRLLAKMNVYLKGECDVGGRTKAMVACYPGNGTGYACHVDNPNRDGRCITCLFYLNEGWDVKVSGGLLRLFRGTDDYVDVEPILNRAIFFWSDRRNPHEVQPAFKTRYAITVWYLDKHEREEARKAANLQASEDVSKIQQQYSMMNLNTKQNEKEETDGQKKEDAS